MRPGARSIAGSLGTYMWVSLGLVMTLAVVLWWGPGLSPEWARPGTPVALAVDQGWVGATLDDGQRTLELAPGEEIQLAPGGYTLTLFGSDGQVERRQLEVGDLRLTLGALSPGPGADVR
jgi:hypothetical protein